MAMVIDEWKQYYNGNSRLKITEQISMKSLKLLRIYSDS